MYLAKMIFFAGRDPERILLTSEKMTFSYMEEKCYFRCLKFFIHEDVQSVMKLK